MAYLKFNKAELVNLEQSLKKELIVTNRTGAYANTTIVCCNTRKYHCLLAVPIEQMNWHRHILLSTLDETLVEHDKKFNLGIHNYGEVFEPRGHKYVVDYSNDPVPTITYNVGDIVIRKEILMVKNEDRVLIRYTLLDANADITLRLQPYLAFRSIHELTHCNITADTRYTEIKNGKAFKLYSALPSLNMQVSKKTDYVANPDWYFGVNYPEERRRGFDYQEDLFVPGFFEMSMKKGESIIFSAGVEAADPATFKRKFTTEMNMMGVNEDYLSTLKNAASHLFFERGKRLEICSGFSWLGVGLLRDTCIIASGLTIFNDNDVKSFLRVFSDIIDKWKDDLVISTTQVEAPLRLASLMQDYNEHTNEEKQLWNKFGKIIKSILDSYITGRPEVKMHDNGLLWAHMPGVSLSWMNTYSDGHPNTERAGYQVETNALWYNALRYAEEMESKYATNRGLADKYGRIADRVAISFNDIFWNEERGMLADHVDWNGQNLFVRPNQLYACGLPYSPLSEERQASILKVVKTELLTSRGIRTLAPKTPSYKGIYEGDQHERDLASHNGSTRPWLLAIYARANFKLYGESFVRKAQELISGFEEDMTIHGIGAVAEMYDGDPPHNPHGAINSATSTSSILEIIYLINKYKEDTK